MMTLVITYCLVIFSPNYELSLILNYHFKHVLMLAGVSGLMSLTFNIVPARDYSLTLGLTGQKLTSNLL